jgi:hypothetical protein
LKNEESSEMLYFGVVSGIFVGFVVNLDSKALEIVCDQLKDLKQ